MWLPTDDQQDVILYRGHWERGAVSAPADKPAWVHLLDRASGVGRYYFGSLASDGRRCGPLGFLYSSDAAEDEAFRAALEEGRPFLEDAAVLDVLEGRATTLDDDALHFTCYAGPWVDDLPHGPGLQHVRGEGLYLGQFQRGLRAGCGAWAARGGALRYRPQEPGASTWQEDAMHGVFAVEVDGELHEGIEYHRDVCRTWRAGLRQVPAIARPTCPDSDFATDPCALRGLSAEALASSRLLGDRRTRGRSMFRDLGVSPHIDEDGSDDPP